MIRDNEKLMAEIGRIAEVAGYLWEKGWAERNGGNISVNVTELLTEEEKTLPALGEAIVLEEAMTELADVTEDTSIRMRNAFGVIRNSARDSFVSLANIVRNQLLNVTNIVKNQSKNSRDAFTRQMISMRKVAETQMKNIFNTVSGYMDDIKAKVDQGMTLKVNVEKKVTTSYVTKDVEQGMMSTMGAIARNTLGIGTPHTMGIANSTVGAYIGGNGGGMYEFSIPLYIDGREVAKATATYNQAELDKLSKRKSRKRGE